MAFKSFRLNMLLRLLLLITVIVALLLVLYRTDWFITAFCLLLLALFQIYDLLYFVERTNRDISSFLEAIRHSDFTQRFATKSKTSSYNKLYQSFNDISDAFQKVKAKEQAHYLYLQAIVEQVGAGILTFDESGEVRLVNQVTKEMFHVPHLKNVEALARVSPELVHALRSTGHNEKALVTVQVGQAQLLVNLHVTEMVTQGQKLKIVTFQNIQSELEEQELQTWQKVIRVLTHEIMNSITPVISLASTVSGMLEQEVIEKYKKGEPLDEEVLGDMQAGLQTIERRSTGMQSFVKNYRRLMRLPASELKPVKVRDLLHNIHHLLSSQMQANKVEIKIFLPEENLMVLADEEQLEQVLINLVKNGMEACAAGEHPCVEIIAYLPEQENAKLQIDVTDNGTGIPEDVLDKIFIPFYTTKEQGSGIGLSLSKQIMRQHGGNIRVRSQPGETTFSLQLRLMKK
ncbi:sensor histidine kinase [Pontibacter sp. MBLB2868]|uniref:sensor histidine kinase n=1 Tax=Pontibacter sp. MBLB2868 TaxID=3451555 RepID=UPI003F752176